MMVGIIIGFLLYAVLTFYTYSCLHEYVMFLTKKANCDISVYDFWMCMFLGMLPLLLPVIGNILALVFLEIINIKRIKNKKNN